MFIFIVRTANMSYIFNIYTSTWTKVTPATLVQWVWKLYRKIYRTIIYEIIELHLCICFKLLFFFCFMRYRTFFGAMSSYIRNNFLRKKKTLRPKLGNTATIFSEKTRSIKAEQWRIYTYGLPPAFYLDYVSIIYVIMCQ